MTHATYYWRCCEDLAAQGFAVLDLDLPHFGESDGEPRQVLPRRTHLAALQAALEHVRTLNDVDTARTALFGHSLGGSLALELAARDRQLAAVVAIVPLLDGLRSFPGTPLRQQLRFLRTAARDRLARLVGRPPVLVQAFGAPGDTGAAVARDDALAAVRGSVRVEQAWTDGQVHSPDGSFRNEVAAWDAAGIAFYRPGRLIRDIACPALVICGEHDTVTPPASQLPFARSGRDMDVRVEPFNHFDPFSSAHDSVLDIAVPFLRQRLGDRQAG